MTARAPVRVKVCVMWRVGHCRWSTQGFRKEFADQDQHFEALQKAFRFRTSDTPAAIPSTTTAAAAANDNHSDAGSVTAADVGNPLSSPPEELESHVWERMLEYRESKLASEAAVAAAQAEAAELVAELAVLQAADEARATRMEALTVQQMALETAAARAERDLHMFYCLKQGQLEGQLGAHAHASPCVPAHTLVRIHLVTRTTGPRQARTLCT